MQGLACSIKRTNGDLPLVVLTVKGDLSEESEQAVQEVATLVHVEDFFVRSLHTQRCGASFAFLLKPLGIAGVCCAMLGVLAARAGRNAAVTQGGDTVAGLHAQRRDGMMLRDMREAITAPAPSRI